MDKLNIIFFGDSIFFGQGVSLHKTFVSLASKELESDFPETCIITQNHSINGNTTRMALERIGHAVQTNPCDILFVEFGLNDCNYWLSDNGCQRVSPLAFEANMHEIISRAKKIGVKHIFINTNHPTGRNREIMKNTNITFEQSNEHYNEIIRAVVSEYAEGITLVDIEKSFKEKFLAAGFSAEAFVLPDLLHLNENGHKLYFDIYYPKMKGVIRGLL